MTFLLSKRVASVIQDRWYVSQFHIIFVKICLLFTCFLSCFHQTIGDTLPSLI
jgi:hypothetical protein